MFHLHSYHIFFDLWNIFEHVLRYFIINNNDYNNNYNLLLTFQRVDVYWNEPIEIHELIKLAYESN